MTFQAVEVAKEILRQGADQEYFISNMKLQKLLFYAQGWYLAFEGKPLFSEDVEAWNFGPVVPSVYHEYKHNGRNPLVVRDVAPLSEARARDLIGSVLKGYGGLSATDLSAMTHRQGTPWDQVFEPGANRVISVESMKAFFGEKKQIQEQAHA